MGTVATFRTTQTPKRRIPLLAPSGGVRRWPWKGSHQRHSGLPASLARSCFVQDVGYLCPIMHWCQHLQAPERPRGPVLNQAVEHGSGGQFTITSGFQLSAILRKPSPAKAAPALIPHRRQANTAWPRVRSSVAFVRRPSYRGHRSRRAGIRNPSRKTDLDLVLAR